MDHCVLTIFCIKGDGRDFMPDWENNYLSWSFGLGFVGVVFQYVSGILFLVEARIIQRKEVLLSFVYCLLFKFSLVLFIVYFNRSRGRSSIPWNRGSEDSKEDKTTQNMISRLLCSPNVADPK